MNWLFIRLLAGSVVTSGHDTKEACEGRRVTLTEKGVTGGQCVQAQQQYIGMGVGRILNCNGVTCQ